jgi:hypothetical protein
MKPNRPHAREALDYLHRIIGISVAQRRGLSLLPTLGIISEIVPPQRDPSQESESPQTSVAFDRTPISFMK